MKTKHTPGPWEIMADPDKKGMHPLHDNRFISTKGASDEISFGYDKRDGNWHLDEGSIICQMTDSEEQEANARLIAAAPELLAALQDLVKRCAALDQSVTHDGIENCYAIAKAREAIQRAQGEA